MDKSDEQCSNAGERSRVSSIETDTGGGGLWPWGLVAQQLVTTGRESAGTGVQFCIHLVHLLRILSDGPKSQLLLCFRPSLLTNLKDLPSARLHCQSCNVALSWSVCDSLGQGWLGMLLRTDCKLVVQRCLPGIFDSKFGRVCKSFPGIFFEDVAPEVKVARQKPWTIDHQPVP